MSIDENTRLDLRQAFEQLIGPDLAHAAMEAMPPLDYDQFATKTDLDNLGTSLRAEILELRGELKDDIAEVRRDMAELRTELKDDMAELRTELKGDMAALRTELKGDMAALRTELKGDTAELRTGFGALEASMELRLAKNLRATMLTQVATMAAFAGLITGLG